MNALFIGRFQPFHKGHLEVIKYISKKYDKIIIGVGSSQYCNTVDNPFSSDERVEMIDKSLFNEKIKNYNIVSIPDIHNPPKWVDHVLKFINDFDIVISNSDFTRKLFEEKGFKTQKTQLFNKDEYSGRIIRKKILEGEDWGKLVPEACLKIIKKINGVNRIKKPNF
jgi:nicotinamide-nucleotide adenylyltransferase